MARPTPGVCSAHCPHCHGAFPIRLVELPSDFEAPCPLCGEVITTRRPPLVPSAAERAWLERLAAEAPAADLALTFATRPALAFAA